MFVYIAVPPFQMLHKCVTLLKGAVVSMARVAFSFGETSRVSFRVRVSLRAAVSQAQVGARSSFKDALPSRVP